MKLPRLNKLSALALGLVAAISLVGCASTGGSDDAQGSENAELPILKVGGVSGATKELFDESGIWADAPYQLETSTAGLAAEEAALESGQLDIANVAGSGTLLAQAGAKPQWTAETAPVKAIATWSPSNAISVVVVRADSGIDQASDLRGKKIGVAGVGENGQYIAALNAGNLTPDDVDIVDSEDSTSLVNAFTSGDLDVFSGYLGSVFQLIESGEAKVLFGGAELNVPFIPTYAARVADLNDTNKEPLIRDFIERYNQFLTEWRPQHQDDVINALVKTDLYPQELAEFVTKELQSDYYPVEYSTEFFSSVENTNNLLSQVGKIEKVTDPTATYDSRYNQLLSAKPLERVNLPLVENNRVGS